MENRPEAIFVSNLDMTLGTLITIKEMGLKIPDDIGIVGYDDSDWSTILNPPLTTISQPAYNLGSTASEMLIKKIEVKESVIGNEPLIITLNTNLIVRNSTKKIKK
ncbi:HTH-type transcriptional regulator KdgR [subsurface metagenome]